MKTDIQNELAADVEAAYRATFSPEDNKLREVQSFFEIRGLHTRGKMGDCALRTAHRNAVRATAGARAPEYFAIMAEDLEGPAYGVGLDEVEARQHARESGFGESGSVVKITAQSFNRIMAGDPQAVEIAE